MNREMNELRKEIQTLCEKIKTRRPPAIRRSLREQFLYAVDLPQAADPFSVDGFTELARSSGWQVEMTDGWLQLDKTLLSPPAGWYRETAGPEASCCLSILKRQHGRLILSDGNYERQLIKAAEQGQSAYELRCRKIHEEWAERLRKGAKIPNIHSGYFRGGEETC